MLRRGILDMIQEITNSSICSDDGLYDMMIDVWDIFTNRLISKDRIPAKAALIHVQFVIISLTFYHESDIGLINWNVEADETHKSCLPSVFSFLRTRRLEINAIFTFFNYILQYCLRCLLIYEYHTNRILRTCLLQNTILV